MDIPCNQRLAFKQTCLTLAIALLIGGLLSLVRVALDYASEDAAINREARTLLALVQPPTSRAFAAADKAQARTQLADLLQSPQVLNAELLDDRGAVWASASRPLAGSGGLAERLFDNPRRVDTPLSDGIGRLQLDIDTRPHGSRFLQHAGASLALNLLGSLLLGLLLAGLNHRLLIRPLNALRASLDRRSSELTAPLPCPADHRRDEIGALVEACNRQLPSAPETLEEHIRTLESSNRELLAARHEALAMAQARSQFLANMSHEIRTPLNGLLGMLSLALESPLPAQQRQQLMIAHDSGRMLVELLNDALDLSKFESGQFELEQTPFDLASLVEESASLMSQNAAPGVELTCLIATDLPGEVVGDPMRVRQILTNLLSNALKFTRHGRVDVRLSAAPEGVLLEVVDTGIGIAQDALSRIFQPFTQAEAGISRQFGGTGLGLTLTRRLCHAMHGTLTVESRPGLGSRFSVLLPLPAHAAASVLPPLPGRVLALCSKRSGLHELLQTWLPAWGLDYQRMDTDACLAGVAADLLISDCPDCLFGLRPQSIAPILLIGAYGELLPEEQADRLQPLEQLARPLARATLYQSLQRHLNHGAATSTSDNRANGQRQSRILLVEDNPVNQLVVKGLLGHLGRSVEIARHGEEALKLLRQRDFDLVLMDCNLPLMDGYEATRQIRRNSRWAGLPVIALTANVLPEDRERCQQAGMSDYLSKPLRREELQAMLERWLPSEGPRPA